jgi:hypothetical protein
LPASPSPDNPHPIAMKELLTWLRTNKALTFCTILAAGQSAALAEDLHDSAARALFAGLAFASLASCLVKLTQDIQRNRQNKGPRQ